MKKICICFAGVPGCDKSPLAVRLSWELGLPVFSNDMIRREIRIENQGALDIDQYNPLFPRGLCHGVLLAEGSLRGTVGSSQMQLY